MYGGILTMKIKFKDVPQPLSKKPRDWEYRKSQFEHELKRKAQERYLQRQHVQQNAAKMLSESEAQEKDRIKKRNRNERVTEVKDGGLEKDDGLEL